MNSVVDVNKPLFLSSLSFSLLKSKSLVIDKSLFCKISESMRLIFLKIVFLHHGNCDSEEANGLLFRFPGHSNKWSLTNPENYV